MRISLTRRLLLYLWLLLLAASPTFAAISAATVFECRASGASDTAGGGFVAGSGGTDRSQQNAAQVAIDHVAITSSVTTSVITFTGGTYTVLAGDIGNIVQVISGTNTTPGFFQITAVAAGLNGTWTMDRNVVSAGTQTDLVANMGGALATLSKLSGAMVASNKAYVTGAFTAATGTTPSFAQTVSPTAANPATRLIGYGAARGDATHASLTLQTNTGLSGVTLTGNGFRVEQIDIDCGSLGTSNGINMGSGLNSIQIRNCKITNFTGKGITSNSGPTLFLVEDCELTGGTAAATAALNIPSGPTAIITRCFIHDNACPGIIVGNNVTISFNVIANNSGASSDGIQVLSNCQVLNNTLHNNGRHGLLCNTTASSGNEWRNNVVTNNGGFGIVGNSTTAIPAAPEYDGNAFFSNTSGSRSLMDSVTGIYAVSPYTNVRDVTLSVSPYVGPTTGTTANFALNNTAGGGAACRAAGSPSTFPGNTGTTSFLDIGAVQTRGSNSSPSAGGSPGVIVAQ